MSNTITRRQREVLDYLQARSAHSRDQARSVSGFDINVAEKLAQRGVLNKRETARAEVYWIRAAAEPATGAMIEHGFMVTLASDITTPMGRTENFFLVKARYNGGKGFRSLLQGWLRKLGLRRKDFIGVDRIPADSSEFAGDHVVLDEVAVASARKD